MLIRSLYKLKFIDCNYGNIILTTLTNVGRKSRVYAMHLPMSIAFALRLARSISMCDECACVLSTKGAEDWYWDTWT